MIIDTVRDLIDVKGLEWETVIASQRGPKHEAHIYLCCWKSNIGDTQLVISYIGEAYDGQLTESEELSTQAVDIPFEVLAGVIVEAAAKLDMADPLDEAEVAKALEALR